MIAQRKHPLPSPSIIPSKPETVSMSVGEIMAKALKTPKPAPVRPKPITAPDGTIARRPIKMDDLLGMTCHALDIPVSALGCLSRHHRVVMAREIVTVLARRHTLLSFPDIAVAMGKPKNCHSTILDAYWRWEHRTKWDAIVIRGAAHDPREVMERIEKALLGEVRAMAGGAAK